MQGILGHFFPRVARSGRYKLAGTNIPEQTFMQALEALNEQLRDIEFNLTFLCVGGGALMVMGARPDTHDLDGILDPADTETNAILGQLAIDVAEEFKLKGKHLPDDWINVSVRGILQAKGYKSSDFESHPGFKWSNLELKFAVPGLLLAMKCFAQRPGKSDFNDIVFLLKKLSIQTMEALRAEVAKHGQYEIKDDAMMELSIAWAWPGQTPYEPVRQKALARYRDIKSQQTQVTAKKKAGA